MPILSLGHLISALIGLGIGLFMAWQLWPVEWVGARPADLDPDAKAQYLAAVADAYVASGEDANALLLAQRRLQGMELATDIPNAVAYFQQSMQGDPGQTVDAYQQAVQIDGNIRISYLMRMASGLGVNAEAPAVAVDITTNSSGEGSEVALPPAGENNAAPAAASEPSAIDQFSTSNTFRLLLSGLTSLLLVLGGLYILLRLARANNWLPFATRAAASPPNAQVALPAESMDDRELISAYSHRAQTHVEPFAQDELPPDDLQYRPRTTVMDRRRFEESGQPEPGRREPIAPVEHTHHAAEAEDDAEYEGELYDENYRYADDDDAARRDFERPVYHRSAAGAYGDDADAAEDDWDEDDDQAVAAGIMDQYITHYEQGALDYEERRNILSDDDDAVGASLGEYGIGVNYKNGILGADPSQVIAMDVWLFDKTDDKNAIYKTQVLLSEFANSQADVKDALAGDPASGEPVLPTEGMTFQLEGNNLRLDCEILLAEFAMDDEASGIFDTLEVQFTLRRKGA
ncbi:MAG: hypothetical protein R3A44_28240 [Caldilineaceae bacterium]